MEIHIAKSSGFCFGVKRAISTAQKCAEEIDGEIFTLGPIIHNPQVVKSLEDSHIYAKKDLDEVGSGTVIVRSHGVRLDEFEKAKGKGLNVVDATCPFVKKAQDLVSSLVSEGYYVVIVGEKDHPEVKGLVSYGRDDIKVADSPEALDNMPWRKRIGVVAQTTVPVERLKAVVSTLLELCSEIKVHNTICNATSIRQEESADLAAKVERMIVVGGRNSANTRRLAEICAAIQPKTVHIEVAGELDLDWLRGARSVGITSGASTPDWIVNEVVDKIRKLP